MVKGANNETFILIFQLRNTLLTTLVVAAGRLRNLLHRGCLVFVSLDVLVITAMFHIFFISFCLQPPIFTTTLVKLLNIFMNYPAHKVLAIPRLNFLPN